MSAPPSKSHGGIACPAAVNQEARVTQVRTTPGKILPTTIGGDPNGAPVQASMEIVFVNPGDPPLR
jgi:hypothetical protein